jgi:hypothetical protein
VSRVTLDEKQKPHWISADPDGRRIVLNSGEYGDHRPFLASFDPQPAPSTRASAIPAAPNPSSAWTASRGPTASTATPPPAAQFSPVPRRQPKAPKKG